MGGASEASPASAAMAMAMVAAGPNCDWMRSPGATDPSVPDGQAAKSSGRQTMRTPGRGFANCPSCVTSAKPGQSGKGGMVGQTVGAE
ncbi:hypothetical protein [Thalassospira sp.]|uniref:hypothetical protein n=1 Tax=Thalassospira sp. TaxID=1912094 RepID=UPI0025E79FF9|nr:hypothetical protein [Thalassospira sp.]